MYIRLSNLFKFFLFLIIILVADFQIVAQSQGAPESMNYQAVIRDGSGSIVASQSVGIRIKILQGSSSGISVYEETFAPTTNAYGSIAIQIGTGTVVSGTFNTIDWGANSHFVETAVDISGGTNYTVISTTQLMSVPYALYAKTAGSSTADNDWTESGSNIYRSSGNVGVGTTSPQAQLHLSDGIAIKSTPISSDFSSFPLQIYNGSSSNGEMSILVGAGSINSLSMGYSSGNSIANSWGFIETRYTNHLALQRNGGNVGIGTTSPSAKLEVSGTARITDLAGTGDRMVVADSDGDLSTQAIPSGSSSPWTESGSNIYKSSGNVGIGTSSPSRKLHVKNPSGSAYIRLENSADNYLLLGATSARNYIYSRDLNDDVRDLTLQIGSTDVMTLNSSYNVGIGTISPSAKLEVSGTARITDLAGTGDRMVVADADGDLSTQAIPSGGNSIPNGSNNGDMMYWDGSAWQTIAVGSAGAVLQIIGGVPTWVSSPDIIGPTITLNGNANMNVVVGGTFTDPGATADEGTLTTSGSVDVTTAGTYTITYSATDATGNIGTATRTVEVYQSQFNYTGSAQTFTVPVGVTSISIDAYGASDYCAVAGWTLPGKGGRVECDLSVTPGQVLNIYVGGHGGQYSSSAGWNGGGIGSPSSSGGGGATDIRIGGTNLTDRVIVAGGAGERAHGGGLVGGYPHKDWAGSGRGLGSPGTQTSGGAGGNFNGFVAGDGTLGVGGNWGNYGNQGSGGGGGGYYGGGGGTANSAGGGSSYTHPTLCSSVVHTQGVQTGSGQLIITIP